MMLSRRWIYFAEKLTQKSHAEAHKSVSKELEFKYQANGSDELQTGYQRDRQNQTRVDRKSSETLLNQTRVMYSLALAQQVLWHCFA